MACNIHIRTLARFVNSNQNSLVGPKRRGRTKPKAEDLSEALKWKCEILSTVYVPRTFALISNRYKVNCETGKYCTLVCLHFQN